MHSHLDYDLRIKQAVPAATDQETSSNERFGMFPKAGPTNAAGRRRREFEMSLVSLLAGAGVCAAFAGTATAGIVVTQQAAPAPTYSSVIDFDAVGPGLVPGNTWAASGLQSFTDGANPGVPVGNYGGFFPWLPNGHVADGFAFGLFMTFEPNATEVSFQLWSDAGPPGFFGGLYIYANDQLAGEFNPAWGGIGNTWFNITTTAGSTIDTLVFVTGGFAQKQLFIDNLSFNVPAPGALALLAVGALARRRR